MREDLIEVIGINEANCTNCHQCIAVCPVKFCSDGSDDVVKFNNNLCIGCGRCIEVCIRSHGGIIEKSARFAIDDSEEFEENLNSKEIIALVAPSAHGNFKLGKLITALKKLGVRQVFDVSLGAEITVACYHEGIKNGNMNTPVIATPCPAIVKYIELHHPGLIKFLAPVGSPVYNLSVYVRSLYPDSRAGLYLSLSGQETGVSGPPDGQIQCDIQVTAKNLAENNIDLESLEDGEFDSGVGAGIAPIFPVPAD